MKQIKQQIQKLPKVDVFMPVYNASAYLRQALNSIIRQNYANWRLIACDDASTDDSWAILQEYAQKDPRITLMRNKNNLGNGGTSIKLLGKCKAKYIARMDSDDISISDRFTKQIKFLEQNPKVVALGGQCLLVDKKGKVFGEKKFLTNWHDVYNSMFTAIPVQYPAVMFNTSLIPKGICWYKGINSNIVDDVNLFFSLTKYGEITNLPDYILKYRIHGQNTTLVNPKKTFKLTFQQRINAIKNYNYKPTLKGWVVNLAQLAVVTVIPNKLITPLFYLTKGVKIS